MLLHSSFLLSPLSATTVLLTLCVVFVNGLTDAPNAISTVVVTRCMKLSSALVMSAFFNFIGVVTMSKINDSVTVTVSNIVDFGGDTEKATIALAASLFAIVLWAVVAWYFGIPTSESHALIAGLTGSAFAINGGFNAINGGEWIKTVKGLFSSCLIGFLAGFFICRVIIIVFRNIKRAKSEKIFKWGQIFAAAAMSFMHGAQDGQKFIAVLMMSVSFSGEASGDKPNELVILLCSVIMALGTLTGGKKIIKSIGVDMVRLEKYQGFSADTASSISLLLSTVLGFPVSTTHAKTTAMMGAGAAKNFKSLDLTTIKDIALTWVLTFPGCSLLGFFVTKVFLKIF